MSKTCSIEGCSSPVFSGGKCKFHSPKKPIKKSPLRKKATGKKVARNDTSRGKKAHKSKRNSIKTLKTKLDIIFSLYIRARDADPETGMVECFTSGKEMWWKDSQCGHFQSRRHNSTRWHTQNAHAQSPYANMYLSGEQYVYGKKIDKIYGEGTADHLVELSKQDFKLTPLWLQEQISYFSTEFEKLKKEKNLGR